MRLQGRNTTATVRLTTDLPNIRPVRLQVGPGLTFTLSAREATDLATALAGAVDQLNNHQLKEAASVLRVTLNDDDGVIGVDDDRVMRTAPLGVVSGAVVGVVTGCPSG